MLSLLQNFHFLSVCMIVFLSLSIIFQTIAGVMIHVLLQESENMSMIRSNALKQCRQKYVNYYKLNGRMINTSVYVDKFIKKLKLLGIPLTRYLQLSGQMMFFFILSTGISIFLQLSFGKTLFDMVPYYLIFPSSRSWKPCWRNSYTNHENKVRIALPVSSILFSEFSD